MLRVAPARPLAFFAFYRRRLRFHHRYPHLFSFLFPLWNVIPTFGVDAVPTFASLFRTSPVPSIAFSSPRLARGVSPRRLSLSRPRLGAYRRSSRWRSRWRARCYRRTSSRDAVSPATRARRSSRARLRVSERLSARRRPRTRARARSRARAMRRSTRCFVSIRARARARGRGRRPRGTSRRRDRATSAESTRRTRRKVLITDASGRE